MEQKIYKKSILHYEQYAELKETTSKMIQQLAILKTLLQKTKGKYENEINLINEIAEKLNRLEYKYECEL